MGLLAVPLTLEQFNNIFGSETITIWKFAFVKFDKYRIGERGAPDVRRLVRIFTQLYTILLKNYL